MSCTNGRCAQKLPQELGDKRQLQKVMLAIKKTANCDHILKARHPREQSHNFPEKLQFAFFFFFKSFRSFSSSASVVIILCRCLQLLKSSYFMNQCDTSCCSAAVGWGRKLSHLTVFWLPLAFLVHSLFFTVPPQSVAIMQYLIFWSVIFLVRIIEWPGLKRTTVIIQLQHPPAMCKVANHQTRLPRATSSLALNASRDGASTASLGNRRRAGPNQVCLFTVPEASQTIRNSSLSSSTAVTNSLSIHHGNFCSTLFLANLESNSLGREQGSLQPVLPRVYIHWLLYKKLGRLTGRKFLLELSS